LSLEQTNNRFSSALENMTHGLCMFDAEKRLVICNERYADLYHLPPELLKVGTPHQAIIAHRVANHVFADEKDGDATYTQHDASSPSSSEDISSRVKELSDGRLIRIVRKPMQGGGWVAIHEDITESSSRAEQEKRRAEIDAAIARGEDTGPLGGVPVTIKVNVDQAGFATTNGLKIQRDVIASRNNPVVENLRKAGAVLLGRTNCPAFSYRWFTTNLIHGDTRNPRDPGITPGGSSGGAGAAGALVVGYALWPSHRLERADALAAKPGERFINNWIKVGADDSVVAEDVRHRAPALPITAPSKTSAKLTLAGTFAEG
jgi:hypothetical protein